MFGLISMFSMLSIMNYDHSWLPCHFWFGCPMDKMVTIKSSVVFKCQNLMDMNFSMTLMDAMDAPMYVVYFFLRNLYHVLTNQPNKIALSEFVLCYQN